MLWEVTKTKSKKMRQVDLSPSVLAVLQRGKEIRQRAKFSGLLVEKVEIVSVDLVKA